MKTIREKLVAGLTKRGSQVVDNRSKKYVSLSVPGEPDHFYFVGKAGALRSGRTIADSVSRPVLRQQILRESE